MNNCKRKRSAYMKNYREKKRLKIENVEKVVKTRAIRNKEYRERIKLKGRTWEDRIQWMQKFMTSSFYDNPLDQVCDICDRIWFRKDVRLTKRNEFRVLKNLVNDSSKYELTICRSCMHHVKKEKVPRLATVNGFKFVKIPEHLPDLDIITERLISPRLPFMRMVHLRYCPGSCKIVGQVINVPVDVQEMVSSLPRNLGDDILFNVCVKRHLLHKSTYLSGCVKKRDIYLWLEALSNTELFREYNIRISYQDIEDRYNGDEERVFEYREKLLDNLHDDNTEGLMSVYQETVFWSDDMVLNIAPGQNQTPIALSYDADAEELSFPGVYFGTRRTFTYNVRPFQVMTSEIRRSDRRAVKPSHILYKATKLLRDRFVEGLQRVFKRGGDKFKSITREDLENKERVREFMDRDLAFFRTIPNSMQYWHMKKLDLFAMIRQLGKPTVFLTLSASEVHWPELMKLLHKFRCEDSDETKFDFDSCPADIRARMVNEDPVITCLYFDKLIDTIMKALKKKNECTPFGKFRVVDFFKRVEFQHRGSPHVHILLWLENAPCESLSENMPQTIQMIDFLMTTNIHELVSERLSIQMHRHTHTCYKNNLKKCRFGIPFWPMKETRILLPVKQQDIVLQKRFTSIHSNLQDTEYNDFEDFFEKNDIWSAEEYFEILRHGITRPMVFLKRDVHDCFVNAFNPALSAIIDSNMDIQYILDEYSCAAYVAEYVNKSNRGFSSLHRELLAIRNEFPSLDYDDVLKAVGKKALARVEMCAQEAAWVLLRLEMSHASRKIEFIPTHHPTHRILCHKTKQQMDKEDLESTSTNIWLQNKVQYYENRPVELENLCLADFIAKYDKVVRRNEKSTDSFDNNEENDEEPQELTEGHEDEYELSYVEISSVRYRKRALDKVIKWVNFDSSTDSLNYKREMITLFHPFRNEELDLLEGDKYLTLFESYKSQLLTKRKEYEKELDVLKMSNMLEHLQTNETIQSEEVYQPLVRNVDSLEPLPPSVNEDIKCIQRITVVRKRDNRMTNEKFCELVRCATSKQKELILEYINCLLYEPENKLKIFLTGPAGTGKTFLLKILMESTNRFSRETFNHGSKNMYLSTATTGKAAIGVDGTTVHAAFRINTMRNKDSTLSAQAVHSMRCEFRHLETIIIDEISMLGQNTLILVDERLRNISNNFAVPFGDYNMILCGDLRQLPPVNAKPVYERPANLLQSNMAWHSLKYYPLTEVVRQKDITFSSLLTKLGNGDKITKDEKLLLQDRFTPYEKVPANAIRLYHRNKDVDNFNQSVLNVEGSVIVKASDNITGCEENSPQYESTLAKLKKLDVTACGGMPGSLTLLLNAPYLVTQNIDKADRIVNGVVGTLRYIEYSVEDPNKIIRLWLLMEEDKCGMAQKSRNRIHAKRLKIPSTLVPFNRRETPILLHSSTIRVRRTQFPLVPSNALTIHKSQGGSYDCVALEYSKSLDISLVYVGLSRARTLQGLYLTNAKGDFNFYHGAKDSARIKLKTELTRLSKNQLSTKVGSIKHFFENNAMNILNMNIQSINAHTHDIENDPVMPRSDVLALAETWMDDDKPAEVIKGFNLITRKKRKNARAGGVAIYQSFVSQTKLCEPVDNDYFHSDFGDICCSRIEYGEGKHVAVVVVYAAVDTPMLQMERLLDAAMSPFLPRNKHRSHTKLLNFNDHTPVILCGDLNVDFRSSKGETLLEYARLTHNLSLALSRNTITTKAGTSIDYIMTKNIDINVMPYVSYFSYHRPFAVSKQ